MSEPESALTSTLFAVSDPRRRAILDALATGERSVSDLCGLFDVSQPAVSQHLEILRRAGLVTARKDGRYRFYALDATPLRAVFDYAAHFEAFWERKLDALGDLLDAQQARGRSTRRRTTS